MGTSRLQQLHDAGFDRSRTVPFVGIRVGCTQCQAVVIDCVPTHELGCPNAKHECNGCSNLIPVRQKYCADCS